jgi:hypothetical protein
MNPNTLIKKKPQVFIKTSSLLLPAFGILFFSRLIDVLGAPEIINFLHFGVIPVICLLAIVTTRAKDRHQIEVTWVILSGLLIFLAVLLASALVNKAGIINVVLDFMLLTEPFIMLLAVISLPLSSNSIKHLRSGLIAFAFFNLGIALFQYYILGTSNPDQIYGVFFSTAGATVSSVVSMTLGTYYFITAKKVPLWIRSSILFAAFWQIIISDTKLVLASFLIGFVLLSLAKLNNKTLIYIIIAVVLLSGFLWGMENLEIFKSYAIWIKPEYFTNTDNEFFRAKTTAFRIIPRYYDSSWNWFFGLGPGHSVGRLGGWMMEKYWNLLEPLGATWPFRYMNVEIMNAAVRESRNVMGTAMYGPLFSWVGIWGDLGFVGLGAYLFIWFLVWRYICLDDFSGFLVLATFAIGLFPGYLEEPGSMLYTTFLIGLWWHEQRDKQKMRMKKNLDLLLSESSNQQVDA